MNIKDRMQICKIVAQSILVDAQITDAERDLLDKLMDRYNLDADQRREVLARNIDDDPGQMAAEIAEYDSKNELIVELALAVATDGEISSSERVLLDKVATALRIEKEDLEMMLKAAIA
jgi:tellurite resistance protein